MAKKPKLKNPLLVTIIRVIQGILIGAGAILPGISGGVLCVVFGIYRPMMALLAHPKENLPRYGHASAGGRRLGFRLCGLCMVN